MPTKTKEVIYYECNQCGNEWEPRFDRKPKVCPACSAYDWDEPRRAGARKQA